MSLDDERVITVITQGNENFNRKGRVFKCLKFIMNCYVFLLAKD